MGSQLIYFRLHQLHCLNSTGILGREESKLDCYTIHCLTFILDPLSLPGLFYSNPGNMKTLIKEMASL